MSGTNARPTGAERELYDYRSMAKRKGGTKMANGKNGNGKKNGRPTPEQEELLASYIKQSRDLQILKDRVKAKESALKGLMPDVHDVLRSVKGRSWSIGRTVVAIKRIAEKTSRSPSWKKYIEWAEARFAEIDEKLIRKGQKVLENSKKVTPAHDEVVIENL